MWILHKKKSISMQLLESPIPPLTAAALRMIICKEPAPRLNNHKKGMGGGGSVSSALTISKYENFDPLKRAENSVFGPENYFFCKHQIKSQKTDHKGAWGMGSTPAKNVKICQLTIVRKKA